MTLVLVALVAIFLLLSGFFSGAETGAYCVNRVRLRLSSDEGFASAKRLQRLLSERADLVSSTLIGTNMANYLVTIFSAMLLSRLMTDPSDNDLELYTTLTVTPLIFVFGEVVPKNWFRQQANMLMTKSSLLLYGFDKVFRWCGALFILKHLSVLLLRWWHGGDDWERALHPRGEMVSLLKEGVADGVMTDEQSKLVDGVLTLSSVSVGTVMIPRAKVITIKENSRREDILETIRTHPHSRYPVVEARTRKVIGLIDVYDFLADSNAQSIEPYIIQPTRLSPQSSASAALHHMREAQQTFGIVVDRWENCIGVVTVKDLVEEIVGDLTAW